MKYDVFISYNHADSRWAKQLKLHLKGHGLNPFLDIDSDLDGSELAAELASAIATSRCFVILLTPRSVKSGWVGREAQLALARDVRATRRFVLPLLIRDCKIPRQLQGRVRIDCTSGFRKQVVDRIVAAVQQRGVARLSGSPRPTNRWNYSRTGINANLSDVVFTSTQDGVVGWAVGDNGVLLKTTDSGRSWTSRRRSTSADLFGLAFSASGVHGYACGQNGTLLETQDGGATWTKKPSGVKSDLNSIAISELNQSVVAVGAAGVILSWEIGGGRIASSLAMYRDKLWQVHFSRSGNLGCIAGNHGTALVSRDGGRTWATLKLPTRDSLYGTFVLSDDKSICLVGEDGRVMMSRDRGKKWERPILSGLGTGWDDWLNSCSFSPDRKTGWIVGAQGLAANTRDGGKTWSTYWFDEPFDITNVRHPLGDSVWAVGTNGAALTSEKWRRARH